MDLTDDDVFELPSQSDFEEAPVPQPPALRRLPHVLQEEAKAPPRADAPRHRRGRGDAPAAAPPVEAGGGSAAAEGRAQPTRAKHWLITNNRPDERAEGKQLLGDESLFAALRYARWQLERAPTTGHVHLHAYVQFIHPTSFNRVQELFPGCRLDRVNSPKHSREYVGKDDTRLRGPWEYGAFTSQGARTDLSRACELIRESGGVAGCKAVALEAPELYVRNWRGLAAYASAVQRRGDRSELVTTYVLCGEPGTGKSTVADLLAGNDEAHVYNKMGHDEWWFMYAGQPIVVIDDACEDTYGGKISAFLTLHDRGKRYVSQKHGTLPMVATQFILTCNVQPTEWFATSDPARRAAIKRRCTWLQVARVEPIIKLEEGAEAKDGAPPDPPITKWRVILYRHFEPVPFWVSGTGGLILLPFADLVEARIEDPPIDLTSALIIG